jgi:small-conductance mechanosensitive channel
MQASTQLLPVIQLAITPVILITGLGSLLLTMTNRMGRVVDRTRILAGQARGAGGNTAERGHLEAQLRIMYRRAGLVRQAVNFATLSMVCSALLVVTIFVDVVTSTGLAAVITGLFALGMGCLLLALGYFLRDIHLSLLALRLEVDRALERA